MLRKSWGIAIALTCACTACDNWSARGFLGQSQGTLRVAPGMSIDEVQHESSLRLSSIWKAPDGARWATTKEIPLIFDARIAGTSLHFEHCVYHVVETHRGGSPIVRRVQLDRDPVAWDAARAQLLALHQALRADGWQLAAAPPELGPPGTLMEGLPLGAWNKADWALQIAELRDFHADEHAAPQDVRWQQELTFLLREP